MKLTRMTTLGALCGLSSIVLVAFAGNQDEPASTAAFEKMMERAKRFTQPGQQHKTLDRFLGEWKTESRIFMAGKAAKPEAGKATFSWLMKGRWLQANLSGKMMGRPVEGFYLIGYDNFKMSFVQTAVNSIDTAMVRQEGDMDPGGKALLLYGTLDEYLTGEHDKMVKTVWRFPSEDKIIMELHDLPIGEKNTKVVEIVFTKEA